MGDTGLVSHRRESLQYMQSSTPKRIERYLKITIVVASVALIALCALLVREYRHVERINNRSAREVLFSALRPHVPATANDVGTVQVWMTFDYINRLFALPGEYLKTNLTITESQYPRLTISRYARDTHVGQAKALTDVQNAIRTYFVQKQ